MFDSGYTQHMTGDSRIFNSINKNKSNVIDSTTFRDNGKGKVKGLGNIAISNDLSISNVLLVESLNFNLLSVAQLCDLGFKCIFGVDDVEIISVDGSTSSTLEMLKSLNIVILPSPLTLPLPLSPNVMLSTLIAIICID